MFRLKVSHLQALTAFSVKQCHHPAEGTHIHAAEQVRPQGMKKAKDQTTKDV